MKTYTYTFQRFGYFLSSGSDTGSFDQEDSVLLILEPVEYQLELSGDVLQKASCPGYQICISKKGGAQISDRQGATLAVFPETETCFRQFRLQWKEDTVQLLFGHTEQVDNYPNCDGESDRWTSRWITEHTVVYP